MNKKFGIGTSHPSGALHIFASDGLEGVTPDTDGEQYQFTIELTDRTGCSDENVTITVNHNIIFRNFMIIEITNNINFGFIINSLRFF